jgi:hypothetical protein
VMVRSGGLVLLPRVVGQQVPAGVGSQGWSATVLASCLLVGRCSSPAPGDRCLRAAWPSAGSRGAVGHPAGTRGTERSEHRSALDAGGGQVAARPAGNRPVRVRGSGSPGAAPQARPVHAPDHHGGYTSTCRRAGGRQDQDPPTISREPGEERTGAPPPLWADSPPAAPLGPADRAAPRRPALAFEGALAVAVPVPGAGELEADPSLADDGHEPGTHPVAVRPQPGLKERDAVDPVLDLPRVR